MSRLGKLPIKLPDGVTLETTGKNIVVKGPKGTLNLTLPSELSISDKDGVWIVANAGKSKQSKANYGTYRLLLENMIKGVTEGWEKQLELVGTGYRAAVEGKDLNLAIGYSHPVKIEAPEGITFSVDKSIITIQGSDKQQVGQITANIRAVRPPEPYKGKGIKYVGEIVRRKAGKAAKTATA